MVLKKSKFTVGTYIDLKKAFDTIDHSILLEKLQCYGIRGLSLNWINSYLSNRTQFTNYDSVRSEIKGIKCGVPQGSILGPTLFILYINDIRNVSDVLQFILFADDTNVFYTNDDLNTIENTMNNELKKLNTWFNVNKLSLNVSKTKYMIFHSCNKKVNKQIDIRLNETLIERVEVTKFLGILIDECLTWKKHINNIDGKIAKNIGVMYKLSSLVNEKVLNLMYCTVILPYLTYCNIIWGNTYKSNLKKLETLQKKAIRIMGNIGFREHTNPVFHKFKCLKLEDLINLKNLSVIYKANGKELPQNVQSLFTKCSQIYNYNTRSHEREFFKKYHKLTLKNMSCINKGIVLWRGLNNSIKEASDITKFKNQYKNNCINSYVNV